MSVDAPIKISGRLDSTHVGDIEAGFYAKVGAAKSGGDPVVLDLKEVDFISSLGIRMLITAGKLLLRRNVAVIILSPISEPVKEALGVAGLTDLFRFVDSAEAARAGG